jgi:hypothetical protein
MILLYTKTVYYQAMQRAARRYGCRIYRRKGCKDGPGRGAHRLRPMARRSISYGFISYDMKSNHFMKYDFE